MHKIVSLGLLMLLLLGSCWDNQTETEKEENTSASSTTGNRHIMIFSDKTLSLKGDNESLSVYRKSLTEFVINRYHQNGDRVRGHFIHENTLGATPFVQAEFQVQKPDLEGKGGASKSRAELDFKMEMNKVKKQCIQPILESFELVNKSSTNQETDIWATFELMTRFFAEAGPQDTCYAFFISDMVQSVKGEGQHDFHRYQIKTKEEAETLAMEAVKWIRENREVDPQVLSRVQVRMWIPPNPTGKNDFGMLRYYWNKLFAELGVREVREELI